ncbi:MAG: CPBP family glutamic-type intramembrane protease [Candidatus Cloacimonadota bacterium]|nr:CPBP family glutamic-type intramembrane protease [Candidatus Cloacimonadota bacterium]
MKNSRILRIIVFYIIAISLSNIFRFDIFGWDSIFDKFPAITLILFSPLGAIGVIIGAIISISLLKKKRKTNMSIWGTSKKLSILMSLVPIILMLIIGVTNSKGINNHYFGIIGAIATFIYCFSEEIGWRGYLEDELWEIKPLIKYTLIGFLWYLWHLSFIIDFSILSNLLSLGILILGSWGIGQVAMKTKSIIACACFHLLVNIMVFNPIIKDGITGSSKLIILFVSIGIWIFVLRIWGKQEQLA